MGAIPKIIHYCWLGGGEKPPRIQECIDSWKKILPDYEIICWDRERFDTDSVKFVRQAVNAGKWAFAADYIRLYALYNYGGIYLDSDVRVLRSFDPFLRHRAFSGIEWMQRNYYNPKKKDDKEGICIEAAILGAEKGHPVFKDFLDYYTDRDFILPDGSMDLYVLPRILARIAEKHGFRYDYTAHQVLDGDFHIYPYDYFTTQGGSPRDIGVTFNTVALHLGSGSWSPVQSPYRMLKWHIKSCLINIWDDVIKRTFCRNPRP